jgi:hypothetical protein
MSRLCIGWSGWGRETENEGISTRVIQSFVGQAFQPVVVSSSRKGNGTVFNGIDRLESLSYVTAAERDREGRDPDLNTDERNLP